MSPSDCTSYTHDYTHNYTHNHKHNDTQNTNYANCDRETLLGLYHGYDQARIALARLVTRYGSGAWCGHMTRRELWARCHRAGFAPELFDHSCESPAKLEDISRGAHSATLTAFATISDKAEELLEVLISRWPCLCEEAGGPLPSRPSAWSIDRDESSSSQPCSL